MWESSFPQSFRVCFFFQCRSSTVLMLCLVSHLAQTSTTQQWIHTVELTTCRWNTQIQNFHKSSSLAAYKSKTQDVHSLSHMLQCSVDTRNISANRARSARLKICTMCQMHVIFFSFSLHKIINGPEIGTATVNYSDSIEEWMSHQFTTFFHSRHVNRQGKKSALHTQYSLERKRETVSNRDWQTAVSSCPKRCS